MDYPGIRFYHHIQILYEDLTVASWVFKQFARNSVPKTIIGLWRAPSAHMEHANLYRSLYESHFVALLYRRTYGISRISWGMTPLLYLVADCHDSKCSGVRDFVYALQPLFPWTKEHIVPDYTAATSSIFETLVRFSRDARPTRTWKRVLESRKPFSWIVRTMLSLESSGTE